MFPFNAEVLASSYARYNVEVWPAQVVALALALAGVWLSFADRSRFEPLILGRVIGVILAGGWLWCGLVFFLQHFARLDFMAPIYGVVFVIEAALLLWFLVVQHCPLRGGSDALSAAGLVLAFLATVGLPLLSGLGEAGFAAARIVGLAPGPTVLLTLALLLLVEGRPPWLTLIIPLLWCAVAAVTGWTLEVPEALAVAVLGAAGIGLLMWKAWRTV